MKEWCDQRQEIARDLLIPLRGGMNTVGLHAACRAINVLQQEGEQGNVILPGQQRVRLIELVDVVRAIVGRERDTAEHNFDASSLQGRDYLIQVFARAVDGKAAEAVVAPEGNDNNDGFQGQDIVEPIDTVFGGVAADPRIHDVVIKAFGIEILFEKVGITISRVRAVACSQAVTEGDNDRTIISGQRGGLRRHSSRWYCGGLRRRFSLAADDADCKGSGKAMLQSGTAKMHHTFNLAADRRRDERAKGKGAA